MTDASPPPTEHSLHEAALRHLARYATTVAGLVRVLERRIDRWARQSGAGPEQTRALREAARRVAAKLAESGAVSDAAFAVARAGRLTRAGRSRRAIAAHLAQRGTAADATRAALPDDPPQELAAAAITIRRRRFGAFRTAPELPDTRKRELASLARAGFAEATARAALALSPEAAEALITAHRRQAR